MLFTYYNESLKEIGGESQLAVWTGQSKPSSETLERLGIFSVAIPDDKKDLPFELVKEGNAYLATYPNSEILSRFGYLSESDRGMAILIAQSVSPGQKIHTVKGTERVRMAATNNLASDILVSVRWGDGDNVTSQKVRAFASGVAIPELYLGSGIEVFVWADSPGLLITGGWEG